jgi:hypothetical protein
VSLPPTTFAGSVNVGSSASGFELLTRYDIPGSRLLKAVMFGWRLLQLISVIVVIFVAFHFLQRY